MRSVSQFGPMLKRLLPAVIVLFPCPGDLHLACAQQSAQNVAANITPRPAHTTQRFQPSPEQIGDAMLARRRYHEAIDAYNGVAKPSADVWNKMGVSYQMLLDLKDATRCYKESLRLSPFNARTLNNLGSVYDSSEDHPRAERMYRRALKVDPTFANAAMNLGTNLLAQNKYREGLEMYHRAAALAPDVFDGVDATWTTTGVRLRQEATINYYKARSFARAGMTEPAIKYLRQAIAEGFANPQMIAQDSSFVILHESLEYQRLLADEKKLTNR